MLFKLWFCIDVIVIVIIHELAHLLAAIWCKCGVSTVSLGFGKVLLSKRWKDIDWQIRALWLGGFCSLKDELQLTDNKTSFSNLRFYKKAIISLAGVFVNIIMGIGCLLLSTPIHSGFLWLFGYLSLALGITNLIPFCAAVDGGYVVYMPILVKIYGLKRGYEVFESWVKKSFKVIMLLNILSIPFLIYWLVKG